MASFDGNVAAVFGLLSSAASPALPSGLMGLGDMMVTPSETEFFIDNLLVRIHLIIEMIWWTGLAPWEFEFPCSV